MLKKLLRRRGFFAEGDARADGNLRQTVRRITQLRIDLLHLACDQLLMRPSGMQHDRHKLIPADPADTVVVAKMLADNRGDLAQDSVPHLVPIGVIDIFEAVDVQQDKAGRPEVDARQQHVIARAVIDLRQLVVAGLITEACNTALIDLIHAVVGLSKVAEFVHAGDRDGAVLPNFVHGL